LLKSTLEAYEHVVHVAENGSAGLEFLRQRSKQVDVIILDLDIGGIDGESLVEAIRALGVATPVVVQTSQPDGEAMVQAVRSGAFDFLVRPVSPERIAASVAHALKLGRWDASGRTARRSRSGAITFADIVSASSDMLRVVDLAQRAADASIPVVLEGETGVGKHLVARAIHTASGRSAKPFVVLDCNAVAAEDMERALLGSVAGGSELSGKLDEAEGGTLFLNEVGDLPLDVQAKLVRAVQEGEIEPIGSSVPRKVDVRIISATTKDLIEEVREGRFREDLYYRLNVFPITIPALRRRKEDVPHLARVFAERFASEQKLPRNVTVGPAAMALLTSYDWPGNVRELENVLFRAVVLAQGEVLSETDFPQVAAQMSQMMRPATGRGDGFISGLSASSPSSPLEQALSLSVSGHAREAFGHLVPRTTRPDPRALLAAAYPAAAAPENAIPTVDPFGEVRKLSEVEEELIRFALKFYRGQMSQVARKLGIGRSTLYRKLKDYGIDPDDPLKEAA
jgi:DNA-binding NtrC family response regulator